MRWWWRRTEARGQGWEEQQKSWRALTVRTRTWRGIWESIKSQWREMR